MTDTPEAVRLADALEDIAATSSCMFEDEATEAAALLRRIPDLETARNVAIELAAQYAADRDQLRAELEKVRAPEGWRLVPAEPTEAMLDRAVAFALNVHLSSGYGWTQYMRDLWGRLLSGLAAAPTPPHADQKGQ